MGGVDRDEDEGANVRVWWHIGGGYRSSARCLTTTWGVVEQSSGGRGRRRSLCELLRKTGLSSTTARRRRSLLRRMLSVGEVGLPVANVGAVCIVPPVARRRVVGRARRSSADRVPRSARRVSACRPAIVRGVSHFVHAAASPSFVEERGRAVC